MKIAVCFAQEGVDCEDAVRRMTEAMRLCEHHTCRAFAVPGGAVGCVLTSDQHSAIPLLRKGPDGNLLAVSGVPIDMKGTLDERLDRVAAGGVDEAVAELKDLDGAFAALFWDARARKLVIVTDALGIQPLYMTRRDGLLLIATELKAFAASGLVDVEMDPAAWGAFISLGFVIGNRTQLANVRQIEPATTLLFTPFDGSIKSQRHWNWPEPRPDVTLADVDTGHLVDLMCQEIRGYACHTRTSTLLLSGGFDSRLLLLLLREADFKPRILILEHRGEQGNADGRYARRVARRFAGPCHLDVIDPEPDYYASPAFLDYLMMSEVAVPCASLFIAQVSNYIRPETQAVWDGLGPGFVFAAPYPLPGGFDVYLDNRCKGRDSVDWIAAFCVFAAPLAKSMYEEFRSLLAHETARYTDDEYGVAQFQVRNQLRRRMSVPAVQVYANCVLPFTPGLSRAVWHQAGTWPHAITYNKQLYYLLYRRHFPEATRVPFCSGGKLLSARAWAPSLWFRNRFATAQPRVSYYGKRLMQALGGKAAAEVLRDGSRAPGATNPLLDRIIRDINPAHPDLDADTVRRLQQEEPPYSWTARLGRRMLFYWQAWRWIMEGRLTTWNAEAFLQEEMQRTPRGTGRET